MTIVATSAVTGVGCTFSGTYSQAGRMGSLQATYACTDGEAGNALIFEMNNTISTMTERVFIQSTNIGCTASGEFAGVILR